MTQLLKLKNILEGFYSRITEAEEWISDLEYKMVEITAKTKYRQKG